VFGNVTRERVYSSVMSEPDWSIEVGSDVTRNEFFAEVWSDGQQWATVVERDGRYWLRLEALVELECDSALDALNEARRRVCASEG
jgi:hypothetical protein